jgi:hypothetical protein
MSKIKDEFMKQQFTGSVNETGDEDYLYEQYIAAEKMNEEYWQWKSEKENSIFLDEVQYDDEYYKSSYLPTPDEEAENYKQTKQNGHT